MRERSTKIAASRLGVGGEANGRLSGEGRFEVHGVLRGEIDWSGTLVLVPGSTVEAKGRASRLEVQGALRGRVDAGEAYVSAEGSWVGGGSAGAIGTEDGARVEGDFRFGSTAPARAPVAAAPEDPPAGN